MRRAKVVKNSSYIPVDSEKRNEGPCTGQRIKSIVAGIETFASQTGVEVDNFGTLPQNFGIKLIN